MKSQMLLIPLSVISVFLFSYRLFFSAFNAHSVSRWNVKSVSDSANLHISAPVADRVPFQFDFNGHSFIDHYNWLKEPNPKTLNYIMLENRFTVTGLLAPMDHRFRFYRRRLNDIMMSRLASPLLSSFELHGRTFTIEDTPLGSCMFELLADGRRRMIINWDHFAADLPYFQRGFLEISPDVAIMAFSYDDIGNERFKLAVVDMETLRVRRFVDLGIGLYYSARWTRSNRHLVVSSVDNLGIPRFIHVLTFGIDLAVARPDVRLLYEERSPEMTVEVTCSTDDSFIFINIIGQITTEVRYIDPLNAFADPVVVRARKLGVRYHLEHHPQLGFLILMGDSEKTMNNVLYNVATISSVQSTTTEWPVVIPHSYLVFITRIEIFASALVVWSWENAVQNFQIYPIRDGVLIKEGWKPFTPPSPVYSLFPAGIRDQSERIFRSFEARNFTFLYSSYTSPFKLLAVSLSGPSDVITLASESYQAIDSTLYDEKKIFVPNENGKPIPMSVVFKRKHFNDTLIPKGSHVLLRGYGAYGGMIETMFDPLIYPILDEGFIVAFAHVRGDADNGYGWYLDGKFEKKQNSFDDFATCLKYIHSEGWSEPSKMSLFGRSAGGLLIGAAVNQFADLFNAAILNVPYVDVIGDMIDESVPWTLYEWPEWGDPNDENIFEAMKNYSPYENVSERKYPHMLFIGGLNDARVPFHEATRIVAKLRHTVGPKWRKKLFLQIHDAGHFSASSKDELAMIYAFLDQTRII